MGKGNRSEKERKRESERERGKGSAEEHSNGKGDGGAALCRKGRRTPPLAAAVSHGNFYYYRSSFITTKQ